MGDICNKRRMDHSLLYPTDHVICEARDEAKDAVPRQLFLPTNKQQFPRSTTFVLKPIAFQVLSSLNTHHKKKRNKLKPR